MTEPVETPVDALLASVDECVRAEVASLAMQHDFAELQSTVDALETNIDWDSYIYAYERVLTTWRGLDRHVEQYANSLGLLRYAANEANDPSSQGGNAGQISAEFESRFASVSEVVNIVKASEDYVQIYEELLLDCADKQRVLMAARSAIEHFDRNARDMFGLIEAGPVRFNRVAGKGRKRLTDRLRRGPRYELMEFQEKLNFILGKQQEVVALSVRKGVLGECLQLMRAPSSGTPVTAAAGSTPTAQRVFRIGESTISFFSGSITDSSADIVVSSDDTLLTMAGGVSQAIQMAAGLEIVRDAAKMVPRAMGDVVVTTAGHMRNRYVVHAVTMKVSGNVPELPRGLVVRQLCQKVMALLPELGCRSVAFPAIGAGVAGIPYEQVAAEMGEALLDAVLLVDKGVEVELYLRKSSDNSTVETFLAAFERLALERFGLSALPAESGSALVNLTPFIVEGAANAQAADRRQSEVMETLRDLDAQRSRLEAQILELTSDENDSLASGVRALTIRLDALAEIRNMYEAELNRVSPIAAAADDSVFVSSTSKDLREHRTAVRNVVNRLHLKFIGMEDFEANALAPAELIRNKVIESEIYLGILGMRYGYVDEASGLSMTELEYRQAIASEKDIRMFVMDEDAPITASMVERDPTQLQQLNEFRERVLKSHSCNLFQTPIDLAAKVERTLADGSQRKIMQQGGA